MKTNLKSVKWYREKSEHTFHGVLHNSNLKYLCGKLLKDGSVVERDAHAISGRLCSKCLSQTENR